LIYANLQAIVVGIPLLKPDLSLVDHEIKPDGSEKIQPKKQPRVLLKRKNSEPTGKVLTGIM